MIFGKSGWVATAALLLCFFALPASAGEFSEPQRNEIGQILREYLLTNPEVLREAMDELERRQTAMADAKATATIRNNAKSMFRSEDDLVMGNPNGTVTMVEFLDYNCSYCMRSYPEVQQLIADDKDLRLVIKEFPVLGPGSEFAAKAALASRKQGKYNEFHHALMQHKGGKNETVVMATATAAGLDVEKLEADMADPAIAAIIIRNYRLAEALAINGTPAFVIADKIEHGAVGKEALAARIATVRKAGGCAFC
jgi:protein-disulfide isomerase